MEELQVCGNDDRVILIDFGGDEPEIENIRQVVTYGEMAKKYSRTGDPYRHYEVDWCRKHQQLIFYAGINGFDGLNGSYWLDSDHQEYLEASNRIHQEMYDRHKVPIPEIIESSFLPIHLWRAFYQGYETEYGVVYCQIEQDYYADDLGHVESPHLIWLHGLNCWGGCGSAEGEPEPEDLYPLFDLAGISSVKALEEALRQHNYKINANTILTADCNRSSRSVNFGQTYNCWELCAEALSETQQIKYEMGIAWLNSLKAGVTDDADLKTAEWIRDYLGKSGRRGYSGSERSI